MPDEGLFVVDTSDLFAALEGTGAVDRRSLGRVCNLIQIPTQNLHNAGNDAYVGLNYLHPPCKWILRILFQYTLQAMMSMAGGDPVDTQREARWPNRTSQGVKVEFKPYEEDSDYSDEEGVVPPQP